MSLSTNALLSLCPAPVYADATGSASTREVMEACTSFPDPASMHPKLLRSSKDSRGMATFTVERLEQQGMPRPKAAPIIKGAGAKLKSAKRAGVA